MFTQAQMESYYTALDMLTADGEQVVPPRRDEDLLVLGIVDSAMADCECGEAHITYVLIREDGLMSQSTTSGTVRESKQDSTSWDDMEEVSPDEWPDLEVRTDMTAFEF